MNRLKNSSVWLVSLATLSLTGCAASSSQPAPASIPSLPESVVKQARSPSNISNEVQSWRQDVLKSFQSDSSL